MDRATTTEAIDAAVAAVCVTGVGVTAPTATPSRAGSRAARAMAFSPDAGWVAENAAVVRRAGLEM